MPPCHWQIAYDIADPKRLRRVEKALSAVGERIHFSLFTCELAGGELAALQTHLARLIEHGELKPTLVDLDPELTRPEGSE